MIELFPETLPIRFSIHHFRLLHACLKQPEGVLQSELVKKLKINKTTLSKAKSDIIRLGWCKDVQLYVAKVIRVKLCRINEIKAFLRWWEFLKKTLLVRPHSINCICEFIDKRSDFDNAIYILTKKYHVQMSLMRNNRKYIFITEYGKIEFHAKGNSIVFWVDGFVLPIKKEDLDNFEAYVTKGISDRIKAMHDLLKEAFRRPRIKVSELVILRKLHLGIILKE
ncbi:MAG: hypothetical protein U9R08_05400, partial [Nanoarchaeota archaeon]|nr:hypothetical protein [Nanoarchaeota archaeon]